MISEPRPLVVTYQFLKRPLVASNVLILAACCMNFDWNWAIPNQSVLPHSAWSSRQIKLRTQRRWRSSTTSFLLSWLVGLMVLCYVFCQVYNHWRSSTEYIISLILVTSVRAADISEVSGKEQAEQQQSKKGRGRRQWCLAFSWSFRKFSTGMAGLTFH